MVLSQPVPWHIAVGNINLDISVSLDYYPLEDSHVFARSSWIGLGGAATNYAVAVASIGHRSSLVARAGGDAVKLGLIDELSANGVDIDYVRIVPHEKTGTVIVILVPGNSSRTIITIRGANELLDADIIPREKPNILHFASVRSRIILSYCKRNNGNDVRITYDPGGEAYRAGLEVMDVISCAETIFLNEKELEALMRRVGVDNPLSLLKNRAQRIIVKHGAGGATFISREILLTASPPKVETVDVTGAGDAFDAAFNAWMLETGDIVESLKAAVAAGAAKTVRRGSSNMPSRKSIERLMNLVKIEEVSGGLDSLFR